MSRTPQPAIAGPASWAIVRLVFGLRRARCSHTPMNGPDTSAGANCAAPMNPIWAELACRVSAAARGMASRLNWVPNSETLWPAQNLRNSG